MPQLGQADRALETKEQALVIAREIGERRFEAHIINNIGHSLMQANRGEDAVESFRRAVAITRETGDQGVEAIALGNLGSALADGGNVDEAKACLTRAIEVFHEVNRPASELHQRIRLATVLGGRQDLSSTPPDEHTL